ncbi:enoyl-CoA hydratase/isomerase family protein [Cupriavidus necator]
MNAHAEPLVLLERADGVALLRLNRPRRHNSLVPELLEALIGALDEIEADTSIRAAVLTHTGPNFSTGGDVAAFAERGDGIAEYADRLLALLNRSILRLAALRCPVVAAVEGWLTGGSLGLVLACDMAVLAQDARIAPFYTVVGFSPDGGWTAMLPKLVGTPRARAWQLNNAIMAAPDAVAYGIAAALSEPGSAEAEAIALARGIAAKVPGSVAHTRALLRWDADALAAGLERERAAFVAQVATAETAEGMRRFLAGRARE